MKKLLVPYVLFTGPVGVVVDAATGSWNKLTPETITVVLEKEEMGAIGPDKIEIELSAAGSEVEIRSDGPPVRIEIRESK